MKFFCEFVTESKVVLDWPELYAPFFSKILTSALTCCPAMKDY